MRINKYPILECIILKIICIGLFIMALTKGSEGCGSYIKVSQGDSAYIDVNVGYGSYKHCIWWLETDSGYQLSINFTYVGDINNGRCGDYIIIRDALDNVIHDTSSSCTSATNQIVTAAASWMQIEFVSDGITSTSGFQSVISSSFVGASIENVTNAIVGCKSYEMGCANKVCMTLSYKCDGFNDCGCDENCDEHLCEGLALGKYTIMLIGGLIGFGLFIVFFIVALAYELHLRKRTLMADPEAQAELQRKKAEKKRKAAYQKAAKERKGRK